MRNIAETMALRTADVDAFIKEMKQKLRVFSVVAVKLALNTNGVSAKATKSSENLSIVSTSTAEMSVTKIKIAQNSEQAKFLAKTLPLKRPGPEKRVRNLPWSATRQKTCHPDQQGGGRYPPYSQRCPVGNRINRQGN